MRVVTVLLSILACLSSVACNAMQGGDHFDLGVVGNVTASSADPAARPPLLVRYDGDVFVAWAEGAAEASLFWRNSEPRAYAVPPRTIVGGRTVVRVRSMDMTWEGAVGDPLPSEARVVFSMAEVNSWHLEFVNLPVP